MPTFRDTRVAILIICASFIASHPLQGQEASMVADGEGIWKTARYSLRFENDALRWRGSSDQHYTHGHRLGVHWRARHLPRQIARWYPNSEDLTAIHTFTPWGLSLYTPRDIRKSEPDVNDRPYAGWSYLGFRTSLQDDTLGPATRQTSFELNVGVVGPAARGREIQGWVHEHVTNSFVSSWPGQLPNQFALHIAGERRWMKDLIEKGSWRGFLEPNTRIDLGNVLTGAGVGASIVYGWNTPHSFGAQQLIPSIGPEDEVCVRFYGSIGAEGRAVFRNIFLDGPLFRESASIARNAFVADFKAGLHLWIMGLEMAFLHVWRTAELRNASQSHRFGVAHVSLGRRW